LLHASSLLCNVFRGGDREQNHDIDVAYIA
jgi:hypothetical protein